MSKVLSAESIREFFDLPADEALITKYLEKTDLNEIARLAASLTPRQKEFDPRAAVEAAMAIQDEAKAALCRRCEQMVGSMNFSTLLQLARELDVYDLLAGEVEADARLGNPLVGAVIRMIWAVTRQSSDETHARNQQVIGEVLSAADQRSKIPRPGLPCDLEVAIRYAVGSASAPWDLLRTAFIDFLGVFRQSRELERDLEREAELESRIERVSEGIKSMEKSAVKGSESGEIQREREKLIPLREALASRRADRDYRENFTPGRETPAIILAEAERMFAGWWEDPDSVSSESSLAWLSSDFHEFWQRHGKEYRRIHSRSENARKSRARQNSKAASMAATSRENARRLAQTSAFLVFLKTKKVHPSDPGIREFIEDFATGDSGLRMPGPQKKAMEFLSLLCNPAAQTFDAATVGRILKDCRIGAVSFDGFRECLDLLGAGFEKQIGRQPRKSS